MDTVFQMVAGLLLVLATIRAAWELFPGEEKPPPPAIPPPSTATSPPTATPQSPDVPPPHSTAPVTVAVSMPTPHERSFLTLWLLLLGLVVAGLLWLIPSFFDRYNEQGDGKITVNLLQLNDVYEISPIDKGKAGGMARVASLRKHLVGENPNTYTVLAGDFLFPSAIGTVRMKGKQIQGLQMVDVMNATGVDLVTFGNHEFDVRTDELLLERINKSSFDWISANVTDSNGKPFKQLRNGDHQPIPGTKVLSFTDWDGTTVKIGIFGVTINSTVKPYVRYDSMLQAAEQAVNALKGKCDFIVALTHLAFEEDSLLAVHRPEIRLILGGHEHVRSYDMVNKTYIAKADANARTVYVHSLLYDTRKKDLKITSVLQAIDDQIPEDPTVKNLVNTWNDLANDYWKKSYNPCQVIGEIAQPLDGTEAKVRFDTTNLTKMIARAVYDAAKKDAVDCSMYNSGSIRIDDYIDEYVTQYDIIRTLPYGGKICVVSMKGSLIQQLLQISEAHPGNGCFLQYHKIEKIAGAWHINGKPLDNNKDYKVAITDFLVSGDQENMRFLKETTRGAGNAAIGLGVINYPSSSDSLRNDLTKAVVAYMKKDKSIKKSKRMASNPVVPCY
ncbi:MAG TPA: bifunctional metallophosphatase/5'-nucleotidase [Chitinophagaceae bacterium]|nr:bifunctional metallophosphatase/5'-nucleotidase [Chitinophagaceae bacterium]